MAKFKVGDKVKITSGDPQHRTWRIDEVYRDGYYRVVSTTGSIEGLSVPESILVSNAAANAKFNVGDRIKIVADTGAWRKGEKGEIIGGDYLPGYFFVKFDGGTEGRIPEEKMAVANSRACNAKFNVGDRVKTRMPNGGWSDTVVIERIIESDGKKLYVCRTSNGTYPAHEWDIRLVNSRSRNAEPSAQLRKAYDEWKKAEAKFKKWWNPERRFSERPPKDANEAEMGLAFSRIFRKEIGRLPPNGYGSMTLEQMLAANSRAANCGVRSTIPAVNAALCANAVKPGDIVKVEWEYDADKKGLVGMTGEVLKISSGIATVAIREKGNREYIVAGHALRKIANTRVCNEYGTRYIDEGDRVFVVSKKKKGIVKSFKTVKGPQPIISVKYDDGSIGVVDANDLRVIPNSSAANAINSRAAKNDADPYLYEKLKLMIRQGAISEAAGGKPMPGDVVFEYRGKRYYTDKDSAHMVKQFSDAGLVKMHNSCGVRSTIPAVNAALNGGDDAIIRLCNPGNLVEASKAGSLHEVRYGAGFVYPLIGKDGVLVRVFRSLSEAHRSPLLNAALGAARNGAASVCNDKWIDDFHVIVTAGKPDASLVEALKKKAKAWKIARRNFSDSEAGAAHDKAEEDAKAIAKRLGARWVQQGAVLKVVMPNAARNSSWGSDEASMLAEGERVLKGGTPAERRKWSDRMYELTFKHGGEIPRKLDLMWSRPEFAPFVKGNDDPVWNSVRSRNAYAVDKNGRQIKKGMTLKDEDGDRFYVEKVLYKNVVEDEWGRQYLETDRWAEVVNG